MRGMETPPDFSQYPRPNLGGGFGSGGRGYRGPGIYFDFIGDAWKMVQKNMGVYVVGTLIYLVLNQIINLPFQAMANTLMYGNPLGAGVGAKPGDLPHINFAMIPVAILIYLIPTAIISVIALGITLCGLEEADTGSTSLNTMFSGFKNFLNVALTSLLYIAAIYAATLLCIVPGFYVAGAFAFAPIIAAKEGLGPVQSMQRSYEYLKPHAWNYFGFLFVSGLVACLGLFACCVGVLWSLPIYMIGLALHYREFRGPGNQGYVAPTI